VGDDLEYYLALLPGPKGENAELLRRFSASIVDDYLHWRRNYYPEDPAVLTASERLRLADAAAGLEQHLEVLAARLRRSFPFHSPRYVAHQQSEVALAALAGGLVGTLYNANNVTTESGNVTVGIEIEAASALLEMIGYCPPPALPGPDADRDVYEKFKKASSGDYGWCHLTSGGTAANIEALWVARNVTYHAAWLAELCRKENLGLEVTASGATAGVALAGLEEAKVLNNLPPSVSVRLLADLYAEATKRETAQRGKEAGKGAPKRMWEKLQEIARDKPLPTLLAASPPAVFVTGARHYSLDKAAELLGLGTGAVVHVDTDSRHRMDVADLETKIRESVKEGRTPLAVVAIIGTTEEGAIDPLSDILRLRTDLETQLGVSFWVHADAAWGGYLATIGHPSVSERVRLKAAKLLAGAGLAGRPGPRSASWVGDLVGATIGSEVLSGGLARAANNLIAAIEAGADDQEDRFEEFVSALNAELTRHDPVVCLDGGFDSQANHADIGLLIDQQIEFLHASTTQHLAVPGGYDRWGPKEVPLAPMDPDALWAVSALRQADSVTVDPHKMGYQQYACGAIAFRDDRCRAYVHQKQPYLTGFDQNIARQPLTHVEDDPAGGSKVITESLGAFTLEGSRPSAQATGLWLATKVLPLDQDHHGRLVRDSWRAARQLYAWLCDWDRIERKVFCAPGEEPEFRFVVWTATVEGEPAPPDTNLVIFGLVPTADPTLAGYRRLTGAVYKKFSISAERGEHQHSYSQPFFLSNTRFVAEDYPLRSLSATARHAGISDFDQEYPKTVAGDEENYGVQVLRATVMNPYLFALQRAQRADLLRDLVVAMADIARAEARPSAAPRHNG